MIHFMFRAVCSSVAFKFSAAANLTRGFNSSRFNTKTLPKVSKGFDAMEIWLGIRSGVNSEKVFVTKSHPKRKWKSYVMRYEESWWRSSTQAPWKVLQRPTSDPPQLNGTLVNCWREEKKFEFCESKFFSALFVCEAKIFIFIKAGAAARRAILHFLFQLTFWVHTKTSSGAILLSLHQHSVRLSLDKIKTSTLALRRMWDTWEGCGRVERWDGGIAFEVFAITNGCRRYEF